MCHMPAKLNPNQIKTNATRIDLPNCNARWSIVHPSHLLHKWAMHKLNVFVWCAVHMFNDNCAWSASESIQTIWFACVWRNDARMLAAEMHFCSSGRLRIPMCVRWPSGSLFMFTVAQSLCAELFQLVSCVSNEKMLFTSADRPERKTQINTAASAVCVCMWLLQMAV